MTTNLIRTLSRLINRSRAVREARQPPYRKAANESLQHAPDAPPTGAAKKSPAGRGPGGGATDLGEDE